MLIEHLARFFDDVTMTQKLIPSLDFSETYSSSSFLFHVASKGSPPCRHRFVCLILGHGCDDI